MATVEFEFSAHYCRRSSNLQYLRSNRNLARAGSASLAKASSRAANGVVWYRSCKVCVMQVQWKRENHSFQTEA